MGEIHGRGEGAEFAQNFEGFNNWIYKEKGVKVKKRM